MSPRTRTISDFDILNAAARVVGRVGPARLTLSNVAADVSLAPATLLQRFRSKRGLLLALAEHGSATAGKEFNLARMASTSRLDALVSALVGMTRGAETPEALSNHLAFLQIDLTDPEFHRHAISHAQTVLAEIHHLLDDAVETGELTPCDTTRLARAVQVTYNGALLTWAIYRTGAVADWLRHDLATLLAAFRNSPESSGCA